MSFLTTRARDALGKTFSDYGNFVPVSIEDIEHRYHIFQVTRRLDCLDLNRSIYNRAVTMPDTIISVKVAVLDESKLDGSQIFKLSHGPSSETIVHEELIKAIEGHGLKGFLFEDLDYYRHLVHPKMTAYIDA